MEEKMENEKAHELARQIKAKVDMLVDKYGIDAIDPLKDIKDMNTWIILEQESSHTILLAMKMYLDGVIRTLYREKN